MKISDILAKSTKPFLSLEIVPPLTGMSKNELLEAISPLVEFNPKFINVTCHRDEFGYTANADGSFTRHKVRNRVSEVVVASSIMNRFNIEVVPHIICGGSTKDDILNKLEDLYYLGIQNIMALRGDCLVSEKRFTPEPGGFSYASELVEGIRNYHSEYGHWFSIGVGAYPEKHFEAPNIETDIANLKKKVDAGADYIVTQMFFDNNAFYSFRERCRKAGINVPIIPGLKPISSVKQIEMLPKAFSIDIPVELTSEIAEHPDSAAQIGTEWCISQCRDLLSHEVPAVHFYTMTKSKNIKEILTNCF